MAALPIVAEICLYGVPSTGAGFIVAFPDGTQVGDGKPTAGLLNTDALMAALRHVTERAGVSGTDLVRVFSPGGLLYAEIPAGWCGYYGSLPFKAVPIGAPAPNASSPMVTPNDPPPSFESAAIRWRHLKSTDPRKKPAQEALRKLAGNAPGRGRVTLCKVSADGATVRGYVHRLDGTAQVFEAPMPTS